MKGYEPVQSKGSYIACDIFYLQVEIILHKKIVFKQHINQYIQGVLVHITNMLKSEGGEIKHVWHIFWCSGFHLFLKKILDFQMSKGAVDMKKVGWKRNQIHIYYLRKEQNKSQRKLCLKHCQWPESRGHVKRSGKPSHRQLWALQHAGYGDYTACQGGRETFEDFQVREEKKPVE